MTVADPRDPGDSRIQSTFSFWFLFYADLIKYLILVLLIRQNVQENKFIAEVMRFSLKDIIND